MTLPFVAPRSTNWAIGPFDTNVEQINNFYTMNVSQLVKRESNANKKGNLIRVSLEHRTLPLLAPRSTNWAIGLLDRNVEQINNFYTMNVC